MPNRADVFGLLSLLTLANTARPFNCLAAA